MRIVEVCKNGVLWRANVQVLKQGPMIYYVTQNITIRETKVTTQPHVLFYSLSINIFYYLSAKGKKLNKSRG